MTIHLLVVLGVCSLWAAAASAASITLDFNGFTSTLGGQVTATIAGSPSR